MFRQVPNLLPNFPHLAWVNPWLMVFRHLPSAPLYSVVVNIMKFYHHDRDLNPDRCSENQTCYPLHHRPSVFQDTTMLDQGTQFYSNLRLTKYNVPGNGSWKLHVMLDILPVLLIKDYLVIEQISLMALKEKLCCYTSGK